MRRSNTLSDNLELRELQQQLFGTRMLELNGGLGVLTCTFNFDDSSDTKALMFDTCSLMEIARGSV